MLQGRVLQYVSTVAVSLLIANTSMCTLWPASITPLLLSLKTHLGRPITLVEAALIYFLPMNGLIVGNLFLGIIINNFGQKKSLLASSVLSFIGWGMILFGCSVEVMLAARFIMGVALSAQTVVSMMYIGETVETQIRGELMEICSIAALIGAILAIVLGHISYIDVALVGVFLQLLFFITFPFMPETPYYYIRQKKYDEAEEVLVKSRGTTDVKDELAEMINSVERNMQNKRTIADLFRISKDVPQVFLETLVILFRGIEIGDNMAIILKMTNKELNPNVSNLIFFVFTFLFVLVAAHMIDHFGRKPVLYASRIGTVIDLFIYFFIKYSGVNVSSITWLPITGIFLSIILKASGIASIPNLFMENFFPDNVKGIAFYVKLMYSSMLTVIVVLLFPLVSVELVLGAFVLFFSICCVFGYVFTLYFVIETKGKSVEDIEANF